MVSKAFFKSRNITPFKRLLSIFHSHSFVASSKAVSVENIGLKPDCDSVNNLLLFKYSYNWLKTTLSINLLTKGRTEIGLQLLESVLRPSLNIGETLVRFQAFGNIPVVIERFIIKVKLRVTVGDASFRRRAEMLSRPLALLLGIF